MVEGAESSAENDPSVESLMSESGVPPRRGAATKRPRRTRYLGRKSREVLLPEELDDWVSRQMGDRWSRNQVFEQCIGIAMGKVEAATATEEAITSSLDAMQKSIDALAKQVRMIVATLTVDAKLKYAPPDAKRPTTFPEHRSLVLDAASRITRGDAE